MAHREDGNFINVDEALLAASAERTASGTGAALDLGDRNTLRQTLDVSAISGTAASLLVAIETSEDGTTWRELGTFTARSAIGSQRATFSGADRYVRARWYVSGDTPVITFSVSGDAA